MSEFTEKLNSSELVSNAWDEIDRDQANAGLLIDVIKSEFKDWKPPKQLVELPQIIADWIELIKQRNRNVLTLLDSDDMPDDVYDWLFIKEDDENINLILLAWIDGYTVEKEQLYVLEFPLEDPKKFTETEIKAIDERLMAFAVKVDEVEP